MCNYIKQDEQKYLDWIIEAKPYPVPLLHERKYRVTVAIVFALLTAALIFIVLELNPIVANALFWPGVLLGFGVLIKRRNLDKKYTRALKDYYQQYHELPPFDWNVDGNWIKDGQ